MEMWLIEKKKRVCVCASMGKRFHTLRRGRGAVVIHVTDIGAQKLYLKVVTKATLPLHAGRANATSTMQNRCKNMETP